MFSDAYFVSPFLFYSKSNQQSHMMGLSGYRCVLMPRATMAAPAASQAHLSQAFLMEQHGAVQALHELPDLIQHLWFLLWNQRSWQCLHWYAAHQKKTHSDMSVCTSSTELAGFSTELRWATFLPEILRFDVLGARLKGKKGVWIHYLLDSDC